MSALNWLSTSDARLILLVLMAISFIWLATRGWREHRSVSIAVVSVLGMATIAAGSLICNTACASNCAGRGASTFLSFFGGLVLIGAVLENDNLILDQRKRALARRRRD